MTDPIDRGDTSGTWRGTLLVAAAFSSFSPLSLLAVNAPRGAAPWKFLLVAAVAFVGSIGVAVGLSRWLGRRRATAMVCVLLFSFFSWSAFVQLGARVASSPLVSQLLIPLTVLGILMWAALRFGATQPYAYALGAIAVALVAVPVPGLVSWYAGGPSPPEASIATLAATGAAKPDVFVLILDGYGRADILEESYGFSNNSFLAALSERGLEVSEAATANYSMTAASVASALAMEYLVEPGEVPDHSLRLSLYDVIRGENSVVATLQALGYEYVHIESGWDGSRCGPAVDVCYGAGFLDEAMWTLLSRTPLKRPLESLYGHAFARNGLRALEDVTSVARASRDTPTFVFAHILLPHPPLVVDSRCRVQAEPQPGGGAVGDRSLLGSPALDGRKAGYVDQILCVNEKILRFLDELGDDSVVLVTGDHGPDARGQVSVPPSEWTDADLRERSAVLSALRLPGGCAEAHQQLDLINGMRMMIGCVTGTELEPIPRRFLIFPTPDGDPYPTTESDIADQKGVG